jgi:hypothetical protein
MKIMKVLVCDFMRFMSFMVSCHSTIFGTAN